MGIAAEATARVSSCHKKKEKKAVCRSCWYSALVLCVTCGQVVKCRGGVHLVHLSDI